MPRLNAKEIIVIELPEFCSPGFLKPNLAYAISKLLTIFLGNQRIHIGNYVIVEKVKIDKSKLQPQVPFIDYLKQVINDNSRITYQELCLGYFVRQLVNESLNKLPKDYNLSKFILTRKLDSLYWKLYQSIRHQSSSPEAALKMPFSRKIIGDKTAIFDKIGFNYKLDIIHCKDSRNTNPNILFKDSYLFNPAADEVSLKKLISYDNGNSFVLIGEDLDIEIYKPSDQDEGIFLNVNNWVALMMSEEIKKNNDLPYKKYYNILYNGEKFCIEPDTIFEQIVNRYIMPEMRFTKVEKIKEQLMKWNIPYHSVRYSYGNEPVIKDYPIPTENKGNSHIDIQNQFKLKINIPTTKEIDIIEFDTYDNNWKFTDEFIEIHKSQLVTDQMPSKTLERVTIYQTNFNMIDVQPHVGKKLKEFIIEMNPEFANLTQEYFDQILNAYNARPFLFGTELSPYVKFEFFIGSGGKVLDLTPRYEIIIDSYKPY